MGTIRLTMLVMNIRMTSKTPSLSVLDQTGENRVKLANMAL